MARNGFDYWRRRRRTPSGFLSCELCSQIVGSFFCIANQRRTSVASSMLGARQTSRNPIKSTEPGGRDRKSARLNSSHTVISYAVFCLKKKKKKNKNKTK